MPKIQGKFCILVVGLLLVSAASAQDAATREFIDAANRMVGPDIDTGHLLLFISKMATWGSRDDDAGEVPNLSNYGMDWQFPLPQIPVSKIFPYARLRPLMYCSNCKISSLTFQNNISPSANSVFGSAMIAVKANGRLSIRQATGAAASVAKQQYDHHQVWKCEQFLFITHSCRNEDVYTERGLHAHELDAITTKLQREAVVAMKQEIFAKTGMQSGLLEQALSSAYLDESNKLRALYPEIEYDASELDLIPSDQLKGGITAVSLGNIVDGGILDRIHAVASANARSSFIIVPQPSVFYVAAINNLNDGNFRVRFSTFRVQGTLPTGAFVTSTGVWSAERVGAGSVPSLAQIIAIFPALKD